MQLATCATPAQIGVGSLFKKKKKVYHADGELADCKCWLSGCLAGLVAHWLSGWRDSAW